MGDYTAGLLNLIHGAVDHIISHFAGKSDNDRLLLVYSESALNDSKSCDDSSEKAHVVVCLKSTDQGSGSGTDDDDDEDDAGG